MENDTELGGGARLKLRLLRQLGIGPVGKQGKNVEDQREEYRELPMTVI